MNGKIILTVFAVLVGLPMVGWLGLHIKPKPFPAYPAQTPPLETIELPADLPAPVTRYYKTTIGDRIPVIESAVISGRSTLRIQGITFSSRFRFTHIAGQDYRHYIETTFFGYPLMKVNEWHLGGKARLELPFGIIENEPKIDMAANLSLWGEAIWLPSLFITDPRVRWEAIDDTHARLIVPAGENGEEDTFTATFDPGTGLLVRLEALRWKEPDSPKKLIWRNEPLGWRKFHGVMVPSPAATIWEDEGTPWAQWTVEEVVYNVDVSEYIKERGY